MKLKLATLLILTTMALVSSCQKGTQTTPTSPTPSTDGTPSSTEQNPTTVEPTKEEPTSSSPDTTTPTTPNQPEKSFSSDDVTAIAKAATGCTQYSWKNRGKANEGYSVGMALTFARNVCNPNILSARNILGPVDRDAVAKYKKAPTLPNVWTILHGLGLRESTGRHCVGRDTTADWTKSETAETGLFQFSYNVTGFSSELKNIFNNYGSKKCYKEIFAKDMRACTAGDAKTWGNTQPGMKFQQDMKNCPAEAVEFGAATIRVALHHFGPLLRSEVEFNNACYDMYASVEKLVKDHPEICKDL